MSACPRLCMRDDLLKSNLRSCRVFHTGQLHCVSPRAESSPQALENRKPQATFGIENRITYPRIWGWSGCANARGDRFWRFGDVSSCPLIPDTAGITSTQNTENKKNVPLAAAVLSDSFPAVAETWEIDGAGPDPDDQCRDFAGLG